MYSKIHTNTYVKDIVCICFASLEFICTSKQWRVQNCCRGNDEMVFGWAFKLAYYTYMQIWFRFHSRLCIHALYSNASFSCSIHFRPHSFHIIIIIRRINFLCSSSLRLSRSHIHFFLLYLPEAIRRRSSTHLHHWHKGTLETLISTILFVSNVSSDVFACEPQRVVT